MNKAKDIFDEQLVRARRTRGQKLAVEPFLHLRCADDAVERILDINRTFTNTLLLASPDIVERIISKAGYKLGKTTSIETFPASPPLSDNTDYFDLVINCLNLHSLNNVQQALSEMKRVLKPDGLCITAVFGGETLGGLRHALYEVEEKLYGQVTPRISPMITLQQAAQLLQSTGFAMPVTDRDLVRVQYSGLNALFIDLRRMGETNALVGRSRKPVSKRLFSELETIYARDHMNAAGKLQINFEIVWLTGWKPHKDQPKPLKPGSAKTRLADALGVREQKT